MANVYTAIEVTTQGDDFSIDSQYNYTGTRVFLVKVEANQVDNLDFVQNLLTTSGVPLIGMTHPRCDRLVCKDVKGSVSQDPHYYVVTATYADRYSSGGASGGLDRESEKDPETKDKKPWEVNPTLSIETQDEYTEVAKCAYGVAYRTSDELDYGPDKSNVYSKMEGESGTAITATDGCKCPVLNSARDPFLDPPTKVIKSMSFTYNFAIKAENRKINDWLKLNKSVNFDDYTFNFPPNDSFPCVPFTVLIQNIRAEHKWFIETNGVNPPPPAIPYWDMSVTFVYKEDGWFTNLIDQGLFAYYKDTAATGDDKDNLVKEKIKIPFKPKAGQAQVYTDEARPLKYGKPLELEEWDQYYKEDAEGGEAIPGQQKVYVLSYLLYKPMVWGAVMSDLNPR
jgi:hypothetical protein